VRRKRGQDAAPDRDYSLGDAVYELMEHRETREVWAVRWTDGHLSGARDTVDDERLPTRDELPGLTYYQPDQGDEARLRRGQHLWIVLARWTRFVSALPPQWVLDRQAVTRVDSTRETEP
jgi:hypothetical protein